MAAMSSTRRDYHDPYHEIENFLQQAQDEIGQAFDKLNSPVTVDSRSPNDISKSSSCHDMPISALKNISINENNNDDQKLTKNCSVNKQERGIQRSHSDVTKSAVMSWKTKNKTEKNRHAFARPPSLVEDNIDILKTWADYFAKQVNDAFSSDDDDDQERLSCHIPKAEKCNQSNASSKSNSKVFENCIKNQHHKSGDIFVDFPRKSVSSSSTSSTTSQVKPDELVSFMKRVEESIRRSVSCESNSDSVFMDDVNDELVNKVHNVMTQTSPTVSTSSGSTPMRNSLHEDYKKLEAMSTVPDSQSTSSRDHIHDDSSSLSCLSNEESLTKDAVLSDGSDTSSLPLSKCSSNSSISTKLSDCEHHSKDKESPPSYESLFKINSDTLPLIGARTRPDHAAFNVKCVQVAVHSDHIQDEVALGLKSHSVPTLESKCHDSECADAFDSLPVTSFDAANDIKTFPIYMRATRKHIAELEAIEACTWLRAAGFPQYAQMYEEHQFPVDISAVQKDHYFLDQDAIQSLFRRLNTLNKCAKMKITNLPRQNMGDESEDEDLCALSENWMFLKSNRRWSRVNQEENDIVLVSRDRKSVSPSRKSLNVPNSMEAHSSFDSVLTADDCISANGSSPPSSGHIAPSTEMILDPIPSDQSTINSVDSPKIVRSSRSASAERNTNEEPSGNFHRTGSERFKDGAKALLRRMESFKSRRRKRGSNNSNRDAVFIDDSINPVAVNENIQRQNRLKPPELVFAQDDSSDFDNSLNIKAHGGHRRKSTGRRFFGQSSQKFDDALSDSECSSATSPSVFPSYLMADGNGTNTSLLEQYWKSSRLSPPSPKTRVCPKSDNLNESRKERMSVYDNVPVVFFNEHFPECSDKQLNHKVNGSLVNDQDARPEDMMNEDCANKVKNNDVEDMIISSRERRDSGVGLSLSRPASTKRQSVNITTGQVPLANLSAGQLMVLRKLSLLKLTALMERYSPSNRSGWNWAVPKFIKRIKSPDYKDKAVFGLPLLLVLQRSGQPLPSCIQSAIECLKTMAIDSIGLFRKSGVRSRITHLKNITENHEDKVNFENYQAYDVADMLKQYFRELPEALLTNKLSETFISIFQYIPEEMRFEAMQAAVLLMPDENREVLYTLLHFLNDISLRANENQMTSYNLAVCLAPSLFHMSMPRSSSSSPRRRKTVGAPDQKELKENKAAHECLSLMISECSKLFSVAEEILNQCRYSYIEHGNIVTMDDLSKSPMELASSWERYVDNCIQNLFKDSRSEKYLSNSKGWTFQSYSDNSIDLANKKLGDGHPLRLWRSSTEVEAPPVELLNKLLRERHVWDDSLLNWRIISKLDRNTEIYQFVSCGMRPHPNLDFCVIRTWRTDLSRSSCILIETSIDHPDAPITEDCIRGNILTSRYLIEPCGSGKSRICHISRVDLKGKSPEWYNRAFGHLTSLHLSRLRNSFRHGTEGPETKV